MGMSGFNNIYAYNLSYVQCHIIRLAREGFKALILKLANHGAHVAIICHA